MKLRYIGVTTKNRSLVHRDVYTVIVDVPSEIVLVYTDLGQWTPELLHKFIPVDEEIPE